MEGTMMRVLSAKGYGFAQSDGQEYFVHAVDLVSEDDWPSIRKGQRIQFIPEQTENGMRAKKVTLC